MYKPFPTGTICASQFGLTTTDELRASGLTHSAISRRVARGALWRRHPGVYSWGPGALSFEARLVAAVLAAGDAVVRHRSAGTLLHVSRFRSAVPQVLVTRRHRPIEGIEIRHCLGLDPRDVTFCRGIPVTTVPRLLLDLAEDHTVWQVANVMHEAAFRKLLNIGAIRAMLARVAGRRGAPVVARALELHLAGSAGTRSTLEDAFLALATDLPEPRVNMELEGLEVDCQWPAQRLVVEVDGPGHLRPAVKREDARRDRLLVAAGHTVVRVTDVELERAPDRVLARLLRRF